MRRLLYDTKLPTLTTNKQAAALEQNECMAQSKLRRRWHLPRSSHRSRACCSARGDGPRFPWSRAQPVQGRDRGSVPPPRCLSCESVLCHHLYRPGKPPFSLPQPFTVWLFLEDEFIGTKTVFSYVHREHLAPIMNQASKCLNTINENQNCQNLFFLSPLYAAG